MQCHFQIGAILIAAAVCVFVTSRKKPALQLLDPFHLGSLTEQNTNRKPGKMRLSHRWPLLQPEDLAMSMRTRRLSQPWCVILSFHSFRLHNDFPGALYRRSERRGNTSRRLGSTRVPYGAMSERNRLVDKYLIQQAKKQRMQLNQLVQDPRQKRF